MATVIPPFEVNSDPNIGARWKKWISKFENLLVAMDIKNDTSKRVMMLHYAGDEVNDIFKTLADTGEAKEYKKGKDAITNYFELKVNSEFEVYKFRQATQHLGESMDTFYTRLHSLASNCGFTDNDKKIKSQIIQSCVSSKLRRKPSKII